jgi:hypothetical protein
MQLQEKHLGTECAWRERGVEAVLVQVHIAAGNGQQVTAKGDGLTRPRAGATLCLD